MVREGTGQDPLGLSRISDQLTSFLLPNIITTTNRARDYSFYVWAIADIQSPQEVSSDCGAFELEFQRREAAFALASQIGSMTGHSIVAVLSVKSVLQMADPVLDTDFRVLPARPTGGFGQ